MTGGRPRAGQRTRHSTRCPSTLSPCHLKAGETNRANDPTWRIWQVCGFCLLRYQERRESTSPEASGMSVSGNLAEDRSGEGAFTGTQWSTLLVSVCLRSVRPFLRTWAAGSLGGRSLQRARETTLWVGRGKGHRSLRKYRSQFRGEERTPARLRFPSRSPLQPRPAAPGDPPTGRAGAGARGGPRAGAPSLALLGALRGALGRECAALGLGGG